MIVRQVAFTVIGEPKPQGSKKAYNAHGRAMMKESGGVAFAAWRNAVSEKAHSMWGDQPAMDGPLALYIVFRHRMPASRPKKIRTKGSAYKTTAPDLSKLLRCIEDGLQAAGVIKDDARFCHISVSKYEVAEGEIGAQIQIHELSEEDE